MCTSSRFRSLLAMFLLFSSHFWLFFSWAALLFVLFLCLKLSRIFMRDCTHNHWRMNHTLLHFGYHTTLTFCLLGNICHMDDGGPLYQLECGSTEAKCLYGVASFSLGRTSTPRHRCNSGSFFTKVAQYYEWVQQMLFRHSWQKFHENLIALLLIILN